MSHAREASGCYHGGFLTSALSRCFLQEQVLKAENPQAGTGGVQTEKNLSSRLVWQRPPVSGELLGVWLNGKAAACGVFQGWALTVINRRCA